MKKMDKLEVMGYCSCGRKLSIPKDITQETVTCRCGKKHPLITLQEQIDRGWDFVRDKYGGEANYG